MTKKEPVTPAFGAQKECMNFRNLQGQHFMEHLDW